MATPCDAGVAYPIEPQRYWLIARTSAGNTVSMMPKLAVPVSVTTTSPDLSQPLSSGHSQACSIAPSDDSPPEGMMTLGPGVRCGLGALPEVKAAVSRASTPFIRMPGYSEYLTRM